MQSQTLLNAQSHDELPSANLSAITCQLDELKLIGPEWDGPGSVTPDHVVIDQTTAWLTGHWIADLGTPDICPTADGGVSISWEWEAIEHSVDVRSDGTSVEWCQYNPRTLQSIGTELPMNKQGWDAILAGLKQPAV